MNHRRSGLRVCASLLLTTAMIAQSVPVMAEPKATATPPAPAATVLVKKDANGVVVSQMVVNRGRGTAEFHVRRGSDLLVDGKVVVSRREYTVEFRDRSSDSVVIMTMGAPTDAPATTTVALNDDSVTTRLDVAKAKSLALRMKELIEQGRHAEASAVGAELRAEFVGGPNHIALLQRIERSAASAALNEVAEILATASADEIRRNPALFAINSALQVTAPQAWKAHLQSKFSGGALSIKSHIPPDWNMCVDCWIAFFEILYFCNWIYLDCLEWFWDDPWVCYAFYVSCFYGAYSFMSWCGVEYCGWDHD